MDLDEKKPDFVVCREQKRIPVCASAPCADPGSFVGGGGGGRSNFLSLMRGERIQIPLKVRYHRPPAKRHLNDGTTLHAGLVAL